MELDGAALKNGFVQSRRNRDRPRPQAQLPRKNRSDGARPQRRSAQFWPAISAQFTAAAYNLGITRVTLVGLSRSESLISQFAAKYPDRVASLIYLTGPLDRPYYAVRYQEPEMVRSATERNSVEAELRELCGASPQEVPPPAGSFDAAANQVGAEWRATDPSPPYSAISAPALAFWFLETDKEHFYARACDDVDDQAQVRELLRSLNRASIPAYAMQAHDIGLFEQSMKKGKVVLIPGAQYYTYLSHPDLVSEQIRSFLQTGALD